jgi:hypothetical protein
MRQLSITGATLVAAVAFLMSTAAAIEVTVKSDTRLYDSSGKVIREVTAGSPFQADKASGEWVYGFLRTSGGGVRGWIPIAALELNEQARRKLAAAAAAEQTRPAEPAQPTRPEQTADSQPKKNAVLLRYKLDPGELQVYEVVYMHRTLIKSSSPGEEDTTAAITCRGTYSMEGKEVAADGTIVAHVRFHEFYMQFGLGGAVVMVEGREIGANVRQNATIRAEEGQIAAYVDGKRILSDKWITAQNSMVPDAGELQGILIEARLNALGQVIGLKDLGKESDSVCAFDLKTLLSTNCTYPKEAVAPGSTWTGAWPFAATDQVSMDSAIPGAEQTRYGVLERTSAGHKPCLKLQLEAKAAHGGATRTAHGTYYVDEATGIPLAATITVLEERAASADGSRPAAQASLTMAVCYKGNKLNN